MSDYLKDQARSRQTLKLSKNPSAPRTSDAEKAEKLYGRPSTIPSSRTDHAARLASALVRPSTVLSDPPLGPSALSGGAIPSPTISGRLSSALSRPSTVLSDPPLGPSVLGGPIRRASALSNGANAEVSALSIGDAMQMRSALDHGTDSLAHTLADLGDSGTSEPVGEFGAADTADWQAKYSEDLERLANAGNPARRFKLARDRNRPLEFDGWMRAEIDEPTFSGQVLLRAAIYETLGGKFVTEMTRREVRPPVDYGTAKRPFLFAKVAIFDSLDIAAMSFRTNGGRLSERLLLQIGDVESEFID